MTTFVPETAIGLDGQILLSAGSLIFGIISDHVDESVLIDFNVR